MIALEGPAAARAKDQGGGTHAHATTRCQAQGQGTKGPERINANMGHE